MKRASVAALLLGLGATSLLVPTHSGAAPNNAWSAPVELSYPTNDPAYQEYGSAWFPDIAADAHGSVHVSWYSAVKRGENIEDAVDLLMYRVLRDGRWSPISEVAAPATGGYTVRNGLAPARDGRIHVALRSYTRLQHISAPLGEALSARYWSEPSNITGEGAYYVALAADSAARLHVLWSEAVLGAENGEGSACPGCSDLYYRYSNDGGTFWSAPQNLSRSPDGENRPQIKIDARDRVHAVWDQGVDWYAGKGVPKYGVYRRSDDGGATWSAPHLFGFQGDAVQQMALAVTRNGNPFVVYRAVGHNRLYFQQSPDGGATWSPPLPLPGVRARDLNDNNLDSYALIADNADHIHLLLVGFPEAVAARQANPWLLHLRFDGRAWSAPQVVMGGELYPEWPRVTVAAGNQLHAAWFTRSKEDVFRSDQGARYRVWYSTLATGAPPATTLPLFTPVPTPAPTVLPSATLPPTATPLPPAAGAAPLLSGPPRWEASALRTIMIALLPALVAVGLVVLMRQRRL
jgi:hypothetical protein